MKKFISCLTITLILTASFISGYVKTSSFVYADSIDTWTQVTTTDELVEAFRYYCKSRNLVIEGSALDAITSVSTSAFTNICNSSGINITALQAHIKWAVDGNNGLKYYFDSTGISLYNRIFSEFLQNNNLSVGDSADQANNTLYSGSIFTDKDGNIIPKIKISENETKITNPHYKKVYRLFEKETHKAIADVMCLHDEVIDENAPYELFDPNYTWKRKIVENFYVEPLQVPVFINGELVYNLPELSEIRKYSAIQIGRLWEEVKRFENPHTYYVDLSQKLWDIKHDMLRKGRKG